MPISFKLLRKFGTSDERLKELFSGTTATLKSDATEAEKESVMADVKMRQKIEEIIASRIDEAILTNLKASYLYAAVDLAWDSSTITKRTIPLVMYAQGRITKDKCVNELKELGCADQYTKYDEINRLVKLEFPKFTEVNINLVRSIITRRVAAQSARFTNLYPFFKYEPRGTSEADKLRGDLLSQRVDIMADQFGYRNIQIEMIRDMLIYPHVMAFPACKWDREVEWYDENEDRAEEFKSDTQKPKSRVKREGVPIVVPHPSRIFYDLAHPITSINSDSGCEWFGFWDVVRYSTICDNDNYFNRQEIGYSADSTSWYYSYSSYFNQYYATTIKPPMTQDEAGANDRKSNMQNYTAAMRDSAVYLTHLYWKVKPNQWRMGDYPHPVWLHLVVANSRTVIYAEIMPDCPGFVMSFNESSQRLVNLSMAHDILPFQDQLTNLYSQFLDCVKRDLWGIAMLNLDAFPKENEEAQKALAQFRAAMKSENFYAAISVLEVSLTKMKDLGVDLENIFKVIRQQTNTQLDKILQAISQTIMLAERVLALSPQEQAQLSPRETSATEVQIIAGTTENIYQFISDAIDEGRTAMKRYIYNALMSLGTEDINLPVVSRYRPEVAMSAGFKVVDLENSPESIAAARQFSVIGTKRNLVCDYIFSSRDGAERASNIQAAQVLTQLMGILLQPPVLAMIQRDKLADLVNSIIRQSGAGMDVMIEPPPGTGANPVMEPQPQMQPGGNPAEMALAELPRQ